MSDFWAEKAKAYAEHDAKYPNHREVEIFTCIDCYDMDIAKEERERIIKLLEENFSRFDASNNQVDYMSLSDFIAVIEGGNK